MTAAVDLENAEDGATAGFLAAITPLDQFWPDCCDHRRYRRVPEDWFCAVTDVVCSTAAVAERGFADVNFIAAAGIVAAENACLPERPLVTVFAGDGCVIVLPPERRAAVAEALVAVRQLAAESYRLDLRVGMVPVAELARRGAAILVARLRHGRSIQCHLRGTGVRIADQLVKQEAAFRLDQPSRDPPDLSGLSCRWAPIRARHGAMVSLLVQPTVQGLEAGDAVLGEVGALLDSVLGGDQALHSPVAAETLRFRWPPKTLALEARSRPGPPWLNRLLVGAGTAAIALSIRLGLRLGPFEPRRYLRELIESTQYRQLLDGLCLTIDCRPDQAAQIERSLALLRRQGRLCYGIHVADSAHMTCHVMSLEEHCHFIDTTVGGYWQASGQLKAQLAESEAKAPVSTEK